MAPRRIVVLGACVRALALVASLSVFSGASAFDPDACDLSAQPYADAAAVILEDARQWVITGDKQTLRVRQILLVRTREGLDHAEQFFVYGGQKAELERFAAKVLRPSGERVEVPSALVKGHLIELEKGERLGWMHFTFPAVEPGAVLIWEYEVRGDDYWHWPTWKVQRAIPLCQGRFVIEYPARRSRRDWHGTAYLRGDWQDACKIHKSKIDRKRGRYELICEHLPAYRAEPFAPPEGHTRVAAQMAYEPWTALGFTHYIWGQFGVSRYKRLRGFLSQGEQVDKALASLDLAALPWGQQVAAIDAYVRKTVERAGAGAAGEPAATADEVLGRGWGRPEELTLTTLALLRKAGLKADPVYTGGGARQKIDLGQPDVSEVGPLVIRVRGERGAELWLDPSCVLCRTGVLDPRHGRGKKAGLRLDGYTEPHAVNIPPASADANRLEIRQRMKLTSAGGADMRATVEWSGQADAAMRARSRSAGSTRSREEILDLLGLTSGEPRVSLADLEDLSAPLRAEIEADAMPLVLPVDDLLVLRPPTEPFRFGNELWRGAVRSQPIVWPFPKTIDVELMYDLPAGARVDWRPPPVSLEAPGVSFEGKWETGEEETTLRWTGRLSFSALVARAEDRDAIVEFRAKLIGHLMDAATIRVAAGVDAEGGQDS